MICHCIKRRHVDAGYTCKRTEELLFFRTTALLERPDFLEYFLQRLFAVAQNKRVKKIRQRLGVRSGVPGSKDQREEIAALRGKKRQACKVEHGEHISRAEFVLKTESHHVELPQRR